MSTSNYLPWKLSLSATIADGLNTLGIVLDTNSVYKLLSVPPKFELGQAALPCFPFAKQLQSPPAQIAESLRNFIMTRISSESHNKKFSLPIERIDLAGGYLNFHLNFNALGNDFLPLVNEKFLKHSASLLESKPSGIVVEFSQPNTHKALHVGHLRCLVLGDVVSNLLQSIGNKVVRATYPGDLGTHIAKTLWYLNKFVLGKGENLPVDSTSQADWLGEPLSWQPQTKKAPKLNKQNLKSLKF
jgi:arginyl-tRNA synthetase